MQWTTVKQARVKGGKKCTICIQASLCLCNVRANVSKQFTRLKFFVWTKLCIAQQTDETKIWGLWLKIAFKAMPRFNLSYRLLCFLFGHNSQISPMRLHIRHPLKKMMRCWCCSTTCIRRGWEISNGHQQEFTERCEIIFNCIFARLLLPGMLLLLGEIELRVALWSDPADIARN